MTNAPAVREMPDQAAPVLAAENALSNEQIRYIANTEIVPRHLRGKPEAIVATILKGRSLGFDDIHALSAINFIDGKATLSAEAMVTLVRRAGHSLKISQTPGESATVVGTRKDNGDTTSVTWTMGMAKDAGLIGKDNWKRYPDTMLTWRAISQVCRFLFADVLMGVSYTEDEAREAAERGAVTAAVRDLPAVEEAQIRDEPITGPSDAQLNRIAALEQRTDGYQAVLRGVFGVELASELHAEAAAQYEAMLEQAATSAEPTAEPHEAAASDKASPGDSGADPEERDEASAVGAQDGDEPDNHSPGSTDAPPESPLFDDEPDPEPEPDAPEVVEGEVIEPDPDLVRVAGLTTIPIGNFRGTALNQIHDSWLEWALDHPDRLPAPFVEALELYVPSEKPDVWEKKRG